MRYRVVEYSGYGYAILDATTNKYVRSKSGVVLIRSTIAGAQRLRDNLERKKEA